MPLDVWPAAPVIVIYLEPETDNHSLKGQLLKYISTLPTGYQVRISRLGIEQYFSAVDVGMEEALRRATKFRDELLGKTWADSRENYCYHRRFHYKALEDALAGVALVARRRECGNIEASFLAVIGMSDTGYSRRKSFPIRKHGYQEAFKQATRTRLQAIGMKIDSRLIPMHKPTMEQYVLLVTLCRDAPLPDSRQGRGVS